MNADHLQALEQLSAGQSDPHLFACIARWRLACGDAEGAGQWHYWSLDHPPQSELNPALARLWRTLGRHDRLAPAQLEDWDHLAALLAGAELTPEQLASAQALQLLVLQGERPPLGSDQLLELVAAWKRHRCPAPAVDLLNLLVAFYASRGQVLSSQTANALAELLEQLERYDEAQPWWEHSLSLDQGQLWPRMRLAHQALRCGHPAMAVYYTQLVLAADPQHRWAPPLQQQALVAMGARGSLALCNGADWPASWQRREAQWRQALNQQWHGDPIPTRPSRPVALLPPQAWQGRQQLALWGARDAHALAGWAMAQRQPQQNQPITLWLLASPEPLLLEHQLRQLLGEAATARVRLLSCPYWQGNHHAEVNTLFVAHRAPALPPEADQSGAGRYQQRWWERTKPHRWECQP